jgi:hypothetical protein
VISLLPGTHRLNELFQTHVTRSIRLSDEYFAGLLKHAARHLDVRFRRGGKGDFTALEVGTGWFPVCPVAAVLCGATKVWTFDIAPLIESGRLEKMFEYFLAFAADGRLAAMLPGLRPEKLGLLDTAAGGMGDPEARFRTMGIDYRVCDARTTGIPPESVDFFFSHSVFQYIPANILAEMFTEFRRVSRSGAVHSHHIHPGSEFAYFDRRLSPLHFYEYGDSAWSLLDSALNRQTRLCMPDYRAIFSGCGLSILREENSRRELSEVLSMKLAPRFLKYDPEELRVFSTWIEATAG